MGASDYKGAQGEEFVHFFIAMLMSQLYVSQNLSNCTLEQAQLIAFQFSISGAVINNVGGDEEQLLSAVPGCPAEEGPATLLQPPCRTQPEPPSGHGDSPCLPLTVSVTHI